MSRLGKKPIALPVGVTATLADGVLTMKGPKGELSRTFTDDIMMTLGTGEAGVEITLVPARESNYTRALWGTYAAHLYNMIAGVTEGFTKKLEIEGVGYRAEVKGEEARAASARPREGFLEQSEQKSPRGVQHRYGGTLVLALG